MPEIYDLTVRFVDGLQQGTAYLDRIPAPILALLLLSPTVIALMMRSAPALGAVLPINLAVLPMLAAPIGFELKAALLLASVGVFFVIVQSSRSAARMHTSLMEIQHRVRHLEREMDTFCDALDRRAQIVDRELVEITRRRTEAQANASTKSDISQLEPAT